MCYDSSLATIAELCSTFIKLYDCILTSSPSLCFSNTNASRKYNHTWTNTTDNWLDFYYQIVLLGVQQNYLRKNVPHNDDLLINIVPMWCAAPHYTGCQYNRHLSWNQLPPLFQQFQIHLFYIVYFLDCNSSVSDSGVHKLLIVCLRQFYSMGHVWISHVSLIMFTIHFLNYLSKIFIIISFNALCLWYIFLYD